MRTRAGNLWWLLRRWRPLSRLGGDCCSNSEDSQPYLSTPKSRNGQELFTRAEHEKARPKPRKQISKKWWLSLPFECPHPHVQPLAYASVLECPTVRRADSAYRY